MAEVQFEFICTFAAAVGKKNLGAAQAVKQVVNLFNNIVIAGLTRRQRLRGGVECAAGCDSNIYFKLGYNSDGGGVGGEESEGGCGCVYKCALLLEPSDDSPEMERRSTMYLLWRGSI